MAALARMAFSKLPGQNLLHRKILAHHFDDAPTGHMSEYWRRVPAELPRYAASPIPSD
jgi:hypothetical protein